MAYYNHQYRVVHTSIHPSQISTYSSLAGALTPVSPPSQFSSENRRRVPQIAAKSVKAPIFSPISFDYYRPEAREARQGIAMREFGLRSPSNLAKVLANANELVLAGTVTSMKKIDLDLRIRWSGYEHINDSFTFSVPWNVTRCQLAIAICREFRIFLDKAARSSTSDPAWRVGHDSITYDQLYLVALYSFGDGICQADIAVDPAPPSHHSQ